MATQWRTTISHVFIYETMIMLSFLVEFFSKYKPLGVEEARRVGTMETDWHLGFLLAKIFVYYVGVVLVLSLLPKCQPKNGTY